MLAQGGKNRIALRVVVPQNVASTNVHNSTTKALIIKILVYTKVQVHVGPLTSYLTPNLYLRAVFDPQGWLGWAV